MNSTGPEASVVNAANAMWRNDTPVIWDDIKAPKWQANRTAWLLTCVDLTSLLVGFFVLFFSTQSLQRDQWQALNGGFQARFAPRTAVVEAAPDGIDNAPVRVRVATSGLSYLDTLLRQRMQGDAVWSGLVVTDENQELHYVVPAPARADGSDEIWARLGGVVRGWKNPVGVRVIARQTDAAAAARTAVGLGAKLAGSGVTGVFADVKIDDSVAAPMVQLVVRAQ